MQKTIWVDVETSGTYEKIHAITEVAIIYEENGILIDTFHEYVFPYHGTQYDPKALEMTNMPLEKIITHTPENIVYDKCLAFFNKYVDPFGWNDKVNFRGYNTQFDIKFMNEFFKRSGNEFFHKSKTNDGSWYGYVDYYDVDTYALVKNLDAEGLRPITKNKKLKFVCESEGIDLTNAHNALADITATRDLHKLLVEKYLKK